MEVTKFNSITSLNKIFVVNMHSISYKKKAATKNKEQEFYILLNNVSFGMTIENIRNRVKLKLFLKHSEGGVEEQKIELSKGIV